MSFYRVVSMLLFLSDLMLTDVVITLPCCLQLPSMNSEKSSVHLELLYSNKSQLVAKKIRMSSRKSKQIQVKWYFKVLHISQNNVNRSCFFFPSLEKIHSMHQLIIFSFTNWQKPRPQAAILAN